MLLAERIPLELPEGSSQDVSAFFLPQGSEGLDLLRRKITSAVQELFRSGRVTNTPAGDLLIEQFGLADIPIEPAPMEEYVDRLIRTAVMHSVNTGSTKCLGHMTSVVLPFLRPLADLLLALNQNQVKREASASFTLLERQTIAMMHRLVYERTSQFYEEHTQAPDSTLGIMAAGSTIANITALWIARNRALAPANGHGGPENDGLAAALRHHGCRDAVVIGSRLMHYSIKKACGLLGLGSRNVIEIDVDRRNRLCPHLLRQVIAQCDATARRIIAIVGTAGTTDCGSIDPLLELGVIAREFGIHFHVDAAWGTALLFSSTHRPKLRGLELADSVTLDGHKQLHLPAGVSLLLLPDPGFARVIEKEANYMLQPDSGDLGKRSLEGSRAPSAVFLHAALNVVGRRGYEAIIDRCIRLAAWMAISIRNHPAFQLLNDPETNIVLYRYLPPELREIADQWDFPSDVLEVINRCNERLHNAQKQAGHSFVSRTTITSISSHGSRKAVALRAVIANPLTTESDLEAVLSEQVALGDAICPKIHKAGREP